MIAPNSSSASASSVVPRCANAPAAMLSSPSSNCALLPAMRFTRASNAGRPAVPRVSWNDIPVKFPTVAAYFW